MTKYFDVEVSAHVTILEEQVFTVEAENATEAKLKANERFSKWMNDKHSWCDFDETFSEVLDEYEEEQ